jgi:DNA-binding IclR family transcriptional regulator
VNVARRPDATIREVAEAVGLTERQVHRVLGDLEESGYLRRERIGRRNRYTVERRRRLPDAVAIEVGDLLAAVTSDGPGRNRTYARSFEGSRSVL